MKIAVIGGGNIGTLLAAEMANKGHSVFVYTSKPANWQKTLTVLDPEKNPVLQGTLTQVTDDLQEAVLGAEYIFITLPAQLIASFAPKLEPFVTAGQKIGLIPGSGGGEFAFRGISEKGCVLFGFQRVHSIARLETYGQSVVMLGRKKSLEIGAIPSAYAQEVCRTIENLLDIPCNVLPNYLCVTLTPSNPILHTTRLCSMFADYQKGIFYPEKPRFYEDWTDASSRLLIACDEELQALCDTIPLDLHTVQALTAYYESPTAEKMTQKIRSIPAFRGLTSPMVQMEQGWIPDFSSRYFTADFSFGLKIIKDLAELFAVPAPHISKVWNWYVAQNPEDSQNAFALSLSKEEFLSLYR